MNEFWKIGLRERKADANHICKSEKYPKDNVALMSLYWVLCEFYEKYGAAELASEEELAILRNAFVHKFVKVHDYEWCRKLELESDSFYHISESDLKKQTIRVLQISREALMYLVYAIGMEERKKIRLGAAVSLSLSDYRDEWKR